MHFYYTTTPLTYIFTLFELFNFYSDATIEAMTHGDVIWEKIYRKWWCQRYCLQICQGKMIFKLFDLNINNFYDEIDINRQQ